MLVWYVIVLCGLSEMMNVKILGKCLAPTKFSPDYLNYCLSAN